MWNSTQSLQQPFRMQSSAPASSMTREKELLPRHHCIVLFKRVDRIESSKEPEPVPSTSNESESAACPPSPVTADPSVLPSPTASPVSNSSRLLTPCQSCVPAVYCVLFKVLYCKIKSILFIFCVCFSCIICVRNITNPLQYSTI